MTWEDLDIPTRRRARWLDEKLRAGEPVNRELLRGKFRCSDRTALAAVAALRELGHLVKFSRADRSYRYTAEPPSLPPDTTAFAVTAGELGALRLARMLIQRTSDPHTANALASLESRLVAVTAEDLRRRALEWARDVAVTGPPALPSPYLGRLRAAIRERNVIQIAYRSGRGTESKRTIEPHFLWNAGGDWLLVAWDRDRSAARTFALGRICGLPEILEERFLRRSELDPEVYVAHAWLSTAGRPPEKTVVEFSPDSAQVAQERSWHPSQRTETSEGGGVRLILDVTIGEDLIRWIRSFGPEVRVLEPLTLSRRVAADAQMVADRYREGRDESDLPPEESVQF